MKRKPDAASPSSFGVPPALAPRLYRLNLCAAAVTGVSVGIQAIVAAIVILGPHAAPPAQEELTYIGLTIVHPEYDLLGYVLGCAVALSMLIGCVALWQHTLRKASPDRLEAVSLYGALALFGAALASGAAFLAVVEILRRHAYNRWLLTPFEAFFLAIPALFVLCALVLVRSYLRGVPPSRLIEGGIQFGKRHARAGRLLGDAAVASLLVAMIYIPQTGYLAGAIYTAEKLFHWDHFAMSAAVGYASGKALGTEIPLQYGIGWPLLLAWGKPFGALSYPGALRLALVWASVYYVLVYVFLRCAVRSRTLAFGATLFLIWCNLFAPYFQHLATIWQWPSSTLLRAPLDIVLFLALLAHARSGRSPALIAAGAIAALGVLFCSDTGISMFIVYAIYCLGVALNVTRAGAVRPGVIAFSAAIFLLFLCAGLLVASRGTLLTDPVRLLHGWWDGIFGYAGSGAGSLPFLSRVDLTGIGIFSAFLGICLLGIGVPLLGIFNGKSRPADLVMLCVALYGLARMILFIQRTLPNNLCHVALPECILAAMLLDRALQGTFPQPSAWLSSVPYDYGRLAGRTLGLALLAAAALLLWGSTGFHNYPSVLRVLAKGAAAGGVELAPGSGIAIAAPEMHEEAAHVRQTVSVLSSLAQETASIGVLDEHSTLYYLSSGIQPWRGESMIFYNIFTKAQQSELLDDLRLNGPSIVFIRQDVSSPYFEDTWKLLWPVLESCYEQTTPAGEFAVWRRQDDRGREQEFNGLPAL